MDWEVELLLMIVHTVSREVLHGWILKIHGMRQSGMGILVVRLIILQ